MVPGVEVTGQILPHMDINTPQPSSLPKISGLKLFADRMIRAARLDPRLYEEVEGDTRALKQAVGVVMLSGIARGIGFMQEPVLVDLLVATGLSLLGWYIWSFLTYIIGARLFPESQTQAKYGELLRTIGFSNAPGIFLAFVLIPGIGTFVNLGALVWMFAAMVVAVRQTLNYRSTRRAIGVCFIIWLIREVIVGFSMVTVLE